MNSQQQTRQQCLSWGWFSWDRWGWLWSWICKTPTCWIWGWHWRDNNAGVDIDTIAEIKEEIDEEKEGESADSWELRWRRWNGDEGIRDRYGNLVFFPLVVLVCHKKIAWPWSTLPGFPSWGVIHVPGLTLCLGAFYNCCIHCFKWWHGRPSRQKTA